MTLIHDMEAQDPYDIICVGFGPASLAIAVALHDRGGPPARVLFLERQPAFAWHSGMILPDARMQISFLKDMATFRDPRSRFTFVNYLHQHGRLAAFANLGTFLPLREEFNDYLCWCAAAFADSVRYGESVVAVSPGVVGVLSSPPGARAAAAGSAPPTTTTWRVVSQNVASGQVTTLEARNVVIAVGGTPKIPARVPDALLGHSVIHSSAYARHPQPWCRPGARIAVVGGGQSAVEIFADLVSKTECDATLYIRQAALKPSDDSPFVNEIFNPDQVDPFYALPAAVRSRQIAADQATNYSVARIELLEHVYELMYRQSMREPDARRWRYRIVPLRQVQAVVARADARVDLRLASTRDPDAVEETTTTEEEGGFDLVIFATGYRRDAHLAMLDVGKDDFVIGRDYKVHFKGRADGPGSGVWLQGCCEATHGLSDSLLSILAVRGGKLMDSILGPPRGEDEGEEDGRPVRYTNGKREP
jgi:L-ornithine N5-oxygenase